MILNEDGTFDLFMLTGFNPSLTNLPVHVWVEDTGGKEAKVLVPLSQSYPSTIDDTVVILVYPEAEIVSGELPIETFELIKKWVDQNQILILKHSEGEICSIDLWKEAVPL